MPFPLVMDLHEFIQRLFLKILQAISPGNNITRMLLASQISVCLNNKKEARNFSLLFLPLPLFLSPPFLFCLLFFSLKGLNNYEQGNLNNGSLVRRPINSWRARCLSEEGYQIVSWYAWKRSAHRIRNYTCCQSTVSRSSETSGPPL